MAHGPNPDWRFVTVTNKDAQSIYGAVQPPTSFQNELATPLMFPADKQVYVAVWSVGYTHQSTTEFTYDIDSDLVQPTVITGSQLTSTARRFTVDMDATWHVPPTVYQPKPYGGAGDYDAYPVAPTALPALEEFGAYLKWVPASTNSVSNIAVQINSLVTGDPATGFADETHVTFVLTAV